VCSALVSLSQEEFSFFYEIDNKVRVAQTACGVVKAEPLRGLRPSTRRYNLKRQSDDLMSTPPGQYRTPCARLCAPQSAATGSTCRRVTSRGGAAPKKSRKVPRAVIWVVPRRSTVYIFGQVFPCPFAFLWEKEKLRKLCCIFCSFRSFLSSRCPRVTKDRPWNPRPPVRASQ
jgi:hypothetical protein